MSSGLRPRQGHHKENGCRTVIEQAFAFNEEAQPPLELVVLEHGNDRHGIGCRYQHAEHQRRGRRPVQQPDHSLRHDTCRDHGKRRFQATAFSGVFLT